MTLIVAPAAGAESYCSVEYADAIHAARGNTAWAAFTTEQKEQDLRKGTDYMAAYSGRWRGGRASPSQTLDWPRLDVVAHGYDVASNVVPDAVKTACALLALKAHTATLAPDLGPQKLEVTVGPITTKYAPGTRESTKFAAAEALLAPYLMGGSSTIAVVRA